MSITIALDGMGGDNAPVETVKGAVDSLKHGDIKVVILGIEKDINEELKKYTYDKDKIEVINTTQVIKTDEVPTKAIKEKKDSSMVVGLNMLKDKKVDAFVSAGNTGALLTGATVIVGRIKGIERPALGTVLPTLTGGFTFLIDAGANIDSKPSYLVQFGKMGSVYVENVLGVKDPRVGLINIGVEKEKGNLLTKDAYELLEHESNINFIGNVEAREVPNGAADVLVADAFVGNVVLKLTEGLAMSMMKMIKTELMSTTKSKIGALLAKDAFSNIKNKMDYKEYGGAPFLGLKSLVVKAHGSSDNVAFSSAIRQCKEFIEKDIVTKIGEKL